MGVTTGPTSQGGRNDSFSPSCEGGSILTTVGTISKIPAMGRQVEERAREFPLCSRSRPLQHLPSLSPQPITHSIFCQHTSSSAATVFTQIQCPGFGFRPPLNEKLHRQKAVWLFTNSKNHNRPQVNGYRTRALHQELF